MGEISVSKKLAEYLLKNFDVTKSKRGKIKIDDFSLAGNGVGTKFYNIFFKGKRDRIKDLNPEWLVLESNELNLELSSVLPVAMEYLDEYLNRIDREKATKDIKLPSNKETYLNYVPIVDLENPRGACRMFDTMTGRLAPKIEEKAWERIVGPKHAKLMWEVAYSGFFTYNPHDLEPYQINQRDETTYNLYNPPGHRLERDVDAKLDPRFLDFLEGFFLPSCIDYAYNWIYHSTFKKMETYLVLVGAGGIGKNLLAEAIKYLHGVTNFTKAPPSALDSKFNGHLLNATMVYYDECRFSSDQQGNTTKKNRLKEWSNEYVPIEVKGVDAINSDIYCSAIIATNNNSDVHLEQLDRKFSVLELSEERLITRMGVETTNFLWSYIKEDDFPDALLNYLESKIDKDFNVYTEYRGPKFNELVLSSLLLWQHDLLFNYILSSRSEKYSFKELKESIPYFPNSSSKVNDFLINFTWEGETLGKVVKDEGSYSVLVGEKFKPQTLKTEDL